MNILNKIIYKRHELILNEENVIEALRVIQNTCNSILSKMNCSMMVGNCGWADDREKWFIHFTCSDEEWDALIVNLNVTRVFKIVDVPVLTNGNIYTTD